MDFGNIDFKKPYHFFRNRFEKLGKPPHEVLSSETNAEVKRVFQEELAALEGIFDEIAPKIFAAIDANIRSGTSLANSLGTASLHGKDSVVHLKSLNGEKSIFLAMQKIKQSAADNLKLDDASIKIETNDLEDGTSLNFTFSGTKENPVLESMSLRRGGKTAPKPKGGDKDPRSNEENLSLIYHKAAASVHPAIRKYPDSFNQDDAIISFQNHRGEPDDMYQSSYLSSKAYVSLNKNKEFYC